MFLFFFSSRRRHTRLTCDWSSDVCSSDLRKIHKGAMAIQKTYAHKYKSLNVWAENLKHAPVHMSLFRFIALLFVCAALRSEERRVGKECRSRWSPYH